MKLRRTKQSVAVFWGHPVQHFGQCGGPLTGVWRWPHFSLLRPCKGYVQRFSKRHLMPGKTAHPPRIHINYIKSDRRKAVKTAFIIQQHFKARDLQRSQCICNYWLAFRPTMLTQSRICNMLRSSKYFKTCNESDPLPTAMLFLSLWFLVLHVDSYRPNATAFFTRQTNSQLSK